MKKLLLAFVILLVGCTARKAEPESDGMVYYDMAAFPVFGKVHPEMNPRFGRLPESLHGVVRDDLWQYGCNSAGLCVRFRTDAPEIHAKWTNNSFQMGKMAYCGVGGLDLYAQIDGEWLFVGTGFTQVNIGTNHQRKLVGGMAPQMREYLLNLSLYDEVKTLELGVPEGYTLDQPMLDSPRDDAPIVMYGTSILQGGCASRPGMAYTNILSRRFDRTVINLGFSGNAFLDYEIAHLMAEVKHPAVFVLDYVPNVTPEQIREKGEPFFRILRSAHPQVPVIFVENPIFACAVLDQTVAEDIRLKNAAQKELFEKLRKAGESAIYYVPALGMTSQEDFVDAIHFTDQGMVHYADHIAPFLENVL